MWKEIGLDNDVIVNPFCHIVVEADSVLEVPAQHVLKRGANGLEIYVMAEIPSNILLAKDFPERFDGYSIGSNDLTHLTLSVDRGAQAHLMSATTQLGS